MGVRRVAAGSSDGGQFAEYRSSDYDGDILEAEWTYGGDVTCAECGGMMFVDNGVTYHWDDESEDVDYDSDADHIAISESAAMSHSEGFAWDTDEFFDEMDTWYEKHPEDQ